MYTSTERWILKGKLAPSQCSVQQEREEANTQTENRSVSKSGETGALRELGIEIPIPLTMWRETEIDSGRKDYEDFCLSSQAATLFLAGLREVGLI